jgi:hypothetical protein
MHLCHHGRRLECAERAECGHALRYLASPRSDLLSRPRRQRPCRWELRNNLGAPTRFDAVLLCSHLHGAGAALEQAALFNEIAPGLPMILAAASAREFGAPALAGVGIVEVIRQPLMSAELAGALGRCLSVSGPASRRLRRATADNDVIST